MNLTEVKKSLERQFARELVQCSKRNIVFWYDDEGVFADFIDTLTIENVKIVKLYDNNMFAVKLYIEDTERESNLLIYSPLPRPDARDNWLNDVIKFSQIFGADETSLNLLNFGIDPALRSAVEKYKLFFRSTERSKKFESYGITEYTEPKIDLAVVSVLCRLPAPNLDGIARTLLIEMIRGENAVYESIGKFGCSDAFWSIVSKFYGYNFAEQSLEKLAVLLLCSHLSHSLGERIPDKWREYVSENPNCYVFTDNFMRDSKDWEDYNQLAEFAAGILRLPEFAPKYLLDEIADCDTFADFDRAVIARILENIAHNAKEFRYYREIIDCRKNRRYYAQFEAQYNTLLFACEYFELAMEHKDLSCISASEIFNDYLRIYYKFDTAYRKFITAYDLLDENSGFKNLLDMLENSYTNWFLNELSMKWCAFWDGGERWELPKITSQQEFYYKYARRFIADNERIIVVISDGLRYESAVELNAVLNREQRGESKLDAMFGVIPSNTALGMASLLPHKQIDITEKGDFEIGGISTKGTENRQKILQLVKHEAIAVQYDDIIKLNKTQMSEIFAGMKLIYIYHNAIDARGDNAATENEVFEAAEKTFRELSGLVRKLRNDISAINIIITADHGYIYRGSPLEERDKTPKESLAGVKSGRRYILAKENIAQQGTQSFSIDYLTKNHNGMYAVLPRITNCFKIQGAGSRYVHGGASLQEIVIPVIKFKSDKNASRSMGAKKVTLKLTNLSRKITGVITQLSFHQNEPADDKHLPLRVTAYFADEAGNRISNENIIIADSTDKTPGNRVYKEKFTLKNMAYDKSRNYYLILKDEDESADAVLEQIPFEIDLVYDGNIRF